MSNPQAEKLGLDNLARAQQMQINARLTALQAAQTLMNTAGYLGYDEMGHPVPREANNVDMVTLIATAQEIENYILGNIVKETEDAIATAKLKLSSPRIVRP